MTVAERKRECAAAEARLLLLLLLLLLPACLLLLTYREQSFIEAASFEMQGKSGRQRYIADTRRNVL